MIGFLRAFALLRWRLFVNGLRGRRRDSLEQVARISRLFVLALVVVTFLPGSMLLMTLAFLGGRGLAQGDGRAAALLAGARVILLVVTMIVAVSPILRFGGAATSTTRLALLPVPRRLLFAMELAAQTADPWILVLLPALAALPAGLAAGGALTAAGWALVAGAAVLAVLAALGSAASLLGALLFRHRRLGELAAVGALVALSLAAYVPMIIGRRAEGRGPVPPSALLAGTHAPSLFPSELYVRAVDDAVSPAKGSAAVAVAGLAVLAVALGGAARFAFGRLLDAPGERRNRSSRSGSRLPALPGLTPAGSAIAWTTFRLIVRSVRGRVILFTAPLPALMLGVFWRHGALGAHEAAWGGILRAGVGSGIALIAFNQIFADQFAIDRAGLTLVFLGPASDRDLVLGKAAGGAMALAIPVLAAIAIGLAFHPGGSPLLWPATAVAAAAAYVMQAPVAALVSAVFPAAFDLTKLRAGNAHPLASLLSMAAVGIALVTCAGIPGLTFALTRSGAAALAASAAALAAACGFAALAFPFAAATVGRRRENLAMIAQGR